jgi:hypothetical protein
LQFRTEYFAGIEIEQPVVACSVLAVAFLVSVAFPFFPMTLAPAAMAISRVLSVDQESTTTTSAPIFFTDSTTGRMRDASLKVRM